MCSASGLEDSRRAENMAKVFTATAGSITLAAVGRLFIADQLLAKADVIRAMHERVQCQDPQTECMATSLHEQRSAETYDEVTEDSTTQATLSAGRSGFGYKRARDIAALAHLGALIATKPRIQDGVTAGLPKQPLDSRLAAVIETPLSTYLDALDDEDKPRQSCTSRRRPRQQDEAADEAWQQTVDCRDPASQTRQYQPSNIPTPPLRTRTATTWTSQRTRNAAASSAPL